MSGVPLAIPTTNTTIPQTTKPLLLETVDLILSKQDELMINLDKLFKTKSTIDKFENIEAFENINVGSIMLNPQTYPEVSDYADVYNQNVALLDDPKNMINASFNTYMNIQNKKINNLRQELNKLQTDIQKNKINATNIKGFKSMNNSQILNVEPYNDFNYISSKSNPNNKQQIPNQTSNLPDDYTQSNNKKYIANNIQVNGASQYPNYLIYGNNGCLKYEPNVNTQNTDIYGNTTITPASWAFVPCNANDPKQQFVSTQVNNLKTYNSFITDPSNLYSQIKSKKTTLFGFNVVNPINNQDQCLQLNNDGLSVMPCNLDFEQRFRPIYNTVIP